MLREELAGGAGNVSQAFPKPQPSEKRSEMLFYPACFLVQASCTVLATWEPANGSNASFPCIAEGLETLFSSFKEDSYS